MAFRRWFPRSLHEQAAFYRTFTHGFKKIAPELGFTEADVAALEADNAVMQYLLHTDVSINSFRGGFKSLLRQLKHGKDTGDNVAYVSYTPLPEPPPARFGMFDRLFKLADRIVAAEGYTPGVGIQLRILPSSKEALLIEDMVLQLQTKPLSEGEAEICFKRGRASGVNLYFRRAGSEEWFDLGRFFRSPVKIKIPLTDDRPEKIYLRGKYLDGNDAVGNYSASVELIVAP